MGNIDGIIGNGGIFEIGGVGGNDGLKPTLQFTLQPTLRRTQINTETYMPSFPHKRESEHVRTETRIPSFPRKWESRISGFQSFPIDSRRVRGLDSRLRGNDGFQDYGIVGNDGSGISLRPPRACKRQVHQKCRLKVQTASVLGNQRAVGWASAHQSHQILQIPPNPTLSN